MTKEEFRELIARYTRGEATPEEERLIDSFFEETERQAPSVKTPTDHMWGNLKSRMFVEKVKSEDAKRRYTRRFRLRGLVGVLVFGLILSAFWGYRSGWFDEPEEQIQWLTARTEWGQKSTITLSDGTTIRLNSGSSLRYPEVFQEGTREVFLEGEAFFDVTRDENSPFIVQTTVVTTRVLGTSFNIQAFPEERISVTVATGRVEVTTDTPNDASNVLLTPNHQAIYDPVKKSLVTTQVDIENVLAWKNSILKFDDATLSEVSSVLERWYNVEIEFKSDKIKNCVISGQYKEQSLKHVLESIQYMYSVDYSFQTKNKVQLDGKGCD